MDYRDLNEVAWKEKMRSDDRVLTLRPMEGKTAKGTTGLLDNRLFKGDNKLHALRDPRFSLWSLKFDSGLLPPTLNQSWTNFSDLLDYCKQYFAKRNVEVVEVEDNYG